MLKDLLKNMQTIIMISTWILFLHCSFSSEKAPTLHFILSIYTLITDGWVYFFYTTVSLNLKKGLIGHYCALEQLKSYGSNSYCPKNLEQSCFWRFLRTILFVHHPWHKHKHIPFMWMADTNINNLPISRPWPFFVHLPLVS